MQLQAPELSINFSKEKNSLLISSKTFVKDVFLYCNNNDSQFSDNYFDIEPNETIEIKTNLGMGLYKQIQYISLYEINH